MSAASSSNSRRRLLATSAAASALGLILLAASWYGQTAVAAEHVTDSRQRKPDTTEIRPFHVNVPDAVLVDLRRRIAATRWPDRETVDDRSQGAQLAKLQELVRYWRTGYDWRKAFSFASAFRQS